MSEQRDALAAVLSDSPSPVPTMADVVANRYRFAVRCAAIETGLADAAFPMVCPWTLADGLSEEFLPEG
jgi:hypothetical protein